jgi:hypothetical protein
MRRMILVLTVSAMMMLAMFLTMPAGAQEDFMGTKGGDDEPGMPECEWYGPFGYGNEAWWEYWCWWPGWGWEYVFWAWA